MRRAERWESVAPMSSFFMEHFFLGAKSPIELNIASNSVPHSNSKNAGPALEVLAAGQTHTSFETFQGSVCSCVTRYGVLLCNFSFHVQASSAMLNLQGTRVLVYAMLGQSDGLSRSRFIFQQRQFDPWRVTMSWKKGLCADRCTSAVRKWCPP